ncbi:uncharacterized protein MONBRDRAFT_29546 [Monosiga brevicollis MX1]|uniref:YEATS domain-containing protein n=1 Tax=Monosiga brevicollis TaxID=81824 RepID=A9VBE5_MONBE|nr:uncharacterized protein MONBRDRAFT_29546 [Monosiga brevicollis MX1]EDQ85174.1 predicted protein [Monosiga brevicollis MX1]|eukprot:XP_001749999.1 hypothetical protein [Monosiga brevicollis MX1]
MVNALGLSHAQRDGHATVQFPVEAVSSPPSAPGEAGRQELVQQAIDLVYRNPTASPSWFAALLRQLSAQHPDRASVVALQHHMEKRARIEPVARLLLQCANHPSSLRPEQISALSTFLAQWQRDSMIGSPEGTEGRHASTKNVPQQPADAVHSASKQPFDSSDASFAALSEGIARAHTSTEPDLCIMTQDQLPCKRHRRMAEASSTAASSSTLEELPPTSGSQSVLQLTEALGLEPENLFARLNQQQQLELPSASLQHLEYLQQGTRRELVAPGLPRSFSTANLPPTASAATSQAQPMNIAAMLLSAGGRMGPLQANASWAIMTDVISKAIVYGNSARVLPERDAQNNTHEWTVFLRSPTGEPLEKFIRKVTFALHSSFKNANRVVDKPPYEVKERGWGEFEITIKITFANNHYKTLHLKHMLKLFPNEHVVKTEDGFTIETYDELVFPVPASGAWDTSSVLPPQQQPGCAVNYYELEKDALQKLDEASSRIQQSLHFVRQRLGEAEHKTKDLQQHIESMEKGVLPDSYKQLLRQQQEQLRQKKGSAASLAGSNAASTK